MGQHRPVRHRRAPVQRPASADTTASHAVMAAVWGAVSQVHEVLGERLLQFEDTPTDARLADQLSLLAALHDWRPVTESEAADLAYLLRLYVEPAPGAPRDEVARALSVTIRTMAIHRAGPGVPTQREP